MMSDKSESKNAEIIERSIEDAKRKAEKNKLVTEFGIESNNKTN